MVPALGLAFVSASAQASRDEISAQAAGEMHCNSVAVIQSGPNEYLASGCGRDWKYTCDDDGECSSTNATSVSIAPSSSSSEGDDEAAEAIGSALTDLACACASAGMSSHGSHHAHASSEHHHKRR